MQKKKSECRKLKAAGGLVICNEPEGFQLLLILRNGVWDLPKGKLEKGESIPGCATREVMEEVGLNREPVIEANLGTTKHFYVQDGEEIEKESFWFVMRLSEDPGKFTPQLEEGITKAEWRPLAQAENMVGYQNLKDLIERFRDRVNI